MDVMVGVASGVNVGDGVKVTVAVGVAVAVGVGVSVANGEKSLWGNAPSPQSWGIEVQPCKTNKTVRRINCLYFKLTCNMDIV